MNKNSKGSADSHSQSENFKFLPFFLWPTTKTFQMYDRHRPKYEHASCTVQDSIIVHSFQDHTQKHTESANHAPSFGRGRKSIIFCLACHQTLFTALRSSLWTWLESSLDSNGVTSGLHWSQVRTGLESIQDSTGLTFVKKMWLHLSEAAMTLESDQGQWNLYTCKCFALLWFSSCPVWKP